MDHIIDEVNLAPPNGGYLVPSHWITFRLSCMKTSIVRGVIHNNSAQFIQKIMFVQDIHGDIAYIFCSVPLVFEAKKVQ